jgi:hypothetical protein
VRDTRLEKMTKDELIAEIERLRDIDRSAIKHSGHRGRARCKGDQRCWRINADNADARGNQFDEIVVGDWLHIEQMSGGDRSAHYWAMLGNRSLRISVKPGAVKVTIEEVRGGGYYPKTEWTDETELVEQALRELK